MESRGKGVEDPSYKPQGRSASEEAQAVCYSSYASAPLPSISASLSPFRLPPVEDCFNDVGREAGERKEPADVGDRHVLLLNENRDISREDTAPTRREISMAS